MASFFIRVKKSGKWYVWEQLYENNKSIQKPVDQRKYTNFGFDSNWLPEQAKAHCRELNKQEKWKRRHAHKISAISRRVEDLKTQESIFLPTALTKEFHKQLMERSFGNDQHQKRIHSHFKTVQKILNTLKLEPHQYYENRERFYRYFITEKYSPDYVNKLLRIINLFGVFVCKHRQVMFEEIPAPPAIVKNQIDEAYQDSDDFIGESDPLTPEMLESAKDKFQNPSNFKWLWVSVWFGLRPIEVDGLLKPNTWKLEHRPDGEDILHIYQSKLISLPRPKRWKKIHVLFPEQRTALEYIQTGELKRPTRKTLKTVFPKNFITRYAGRKGFVNLMLSKQQDLAAISAWMGHQSIEMTWKKYRSKEEVILGKKSS